MSQKSGAKQFDIEVNSYGFGLNTVDDAISIQNGQAQGGINFVSRPNSVKRRPALRGIKSTAAFTTFLKGLFEYLQVDGTSKLIGMSGGKVYEVNKSTGAIAERYDITGTGEAWGESYRDKFWICNGTGVAKIENETGYQVGITAPTGASAAAGGSGATLTAGVYRVYACYARKVSGVNRLYSVGQDLGNVTIASGEQIQISSFANSSDAQVNNKVIFATVAGGGVPFFLYETGDNTTTSFNIDNEDDQNTSITYEAFAANNQLPGAFKFLHFHDNRLWGFIDNVGYYSVPGDTVYDYEKFPTLNTIEFPYNVTGAFSVGEHLFMNCGEANKIIWLPFGDPPQIFKVTDERYAFRYMRTVDHHSNGVIGLTNDGVRFFDGANMRFVDQDLSYFVKPEIEEAFTGAGTNNLPCGVVYTRAAPVNRTEYILSYKDTTAGSNSNNRRLVLNLDRLQLFGGTEMIAAWDKWDLGFEYPVIDKNRALFMGQSITAGAQVMQELTTSTKDKEVYAVSGSFLTGETLTTFQYKTKEFLVGLKQRIRVTGQVYALIQNLEKCLIKVIFRDQGNRSQEKEYSEGDGSLWDEMVWDVDNWAAELASVKKGKFKKTLEGKIISFEITQTLDDFEFEFFQMLCETTIQQDRYI